LSWIHEGEAEVEIIIICSLKTSGLFWGEDTHRPVAYFSGSLIQVARVRALLKPTGEMTDYWLKKAQAM
jgi:hypothetical protein